MKKHRTMLLMAGVAVMLAACSRPRVPREVLNVKAFTNLTAAVRQQPRPAPAEAPRLADVCATVAPVGDASVSGAVQYAAALLAPEPTTYATPVHDVTWLTPEQAQHLFLTQTAQWFMIGQTIMQKCRNYEAGVLFLSNYLQGCKEKNRGS